jgi:hypothetical protein
MGKIIRIRYSLHSALSVLLAGIVVGGLMGCVAGNCRRDGTLVNPQPAASANAPVETAAAKPEEKPGQGSFPPVEKRVFVYKYDGSKQCGAAAGVSPEVMAKELQGIKVFSKENKMDGLMHIQVCGAATGKANVFEIKAEDLAKAQAKGFQEWKF